MTSPTLEVHVAPTGSAAATGSRTDPVTTLEAARDLLRRQRREGQPAVVRVAAGRYPVTRPLELGSEDSHTTFAAAGDGAVVVDSAVPLTGWEEQQVNGVTVWAAGVPAGVTPRSLFVNGERRQRPRRPRDGFLWIEEQEGIDLTASMGSHLFQGTDRFLFRAGDLRQFHDLEQVDVVVPHYWVQERMPVAEVDEATRTLRSSRRSIFALRDDVAQRFARYYLDNLFEALGEEPGEWYFDRSGGRVLYVPRPGETPGNVEVFYPVAHAFAGLYGDADTGRWVREVRFEGLTFRHTDWRHPTARHEFGVPHQLDDDLEYASAPQGAVDVDAAIELRGARDCALVDCTVEHVGGYAVALRDGCQGNVLSGNRLRDLGAGGIMLNGAEYAGDPLATGRNEITDNEISAGGRVFPAGIGVLARHSARNTIAHNYIHDLYYSGISVGWSWGYDEHVAKDNHIEYNHIHDIGHGLINDMGGIYLLGVQPGTVLRGNVIHDIRCRNYGGWCIYLDEGSSHVLVEHNLCHDASTQCFHQHYGRENVVRNNVFAFGRRGQVAVGRVEDHLSFTFERNLVVGDGTPAFVGGTTASHPHRLHLLSDLNLYWSTDGDVVFAGAGRADTVHPDEAFELLDNDEWHALGHDRHSAIADPGFADAARRNFALRADTPARDIGFVPPDGASVGSRADEEPPCSVDRRGRRRGETSAACLPPQDDVCIEQDVEGLSLRHPTARPSRSTPRRPRRGGSPNRRWASGHHRSGPRAPPACRAWSPRRCRGTERRHRGSRDTEP